MQFFLFYPHRAHLTCLKQTLQELHLSSSLHFFEPVFYFYSTNVFTELPGYRLQYLPFEVLVKHVVEFHVHFFTFNPRNYIRFGQPCVLVELGIKATTDTGPEKKESIFLMASTTAANRENYLDVRIDIRKQDLNIASLLCPRIVFAVSNQLPLADILTLTDKSILVFAIRNAKLKLAAFLTGFVLR